jgi:hypothetical protein
MNQTRAEEITMREDYGNINLETGIKYLKAATVGTVISFIYIYIYGTGI